MHIWKRCWNFSPEVWTINAQSPKTILKNSKKLTFLKVLLWTSKLVLTTFPNDFIEFSKNCAHSPERTKIFLTKSFLIDMFLLAGGIQFGSPCLEWYNEKTKKCSLDVGKRSEKVNFPSILFFQLPIWRPNRVSLTRLQNFRRKSDISLPKVGSCFTKSTYCFSKSVPLDK